MVSNNKRRRGRIRDHQQQFDHAAPGTPSLASADHYRPKQQQPRSEATQRPTQQCHENQLQPSKMRRRQKPQIGNRKCQSMIACSPSWIDAPCHDHDPPGQLTGLHRGMDANLAAVSCGP